MTWLLALQDTVEALPQDITGVATQALAGTTHGGSTISISCSKPVFPSKLLCCCCYLDHSLAG